MRGQFSLTTINTTIFMATLQLNLDSPIRQIPYFIGDDLWRDLVEFLRANFERHSVFVLSDDNIARHYRDRASEVLDSLSHFRGMITFPAGEASKSREMKAGLEDQLLGQAAGRDSVIIAMGGGVTGDLVGYLAATLHRGVPLIQLPTSLLAMVDSSVGGKVGINHPVGKNLLGAFYHPAATFVDLRFLATLPDEDFRSGMAEVIKYGTTLDDEFWLYLEKNVDAILRREPDALAHIVRTSIAWKIRVVAADEKEGDYRSILNWGHTAGHAVEKLSHFRIPHGFAVASGMRVAARLSQRLLGFPEERVARLEGLVQAFGLDRYRCSDFDPEEIWQVMTADKKARGGQPRFTLMRAPEKPELFYPVEKRELFHVLKYA